MEGFFLKETSKLMGSYKKIVFLYIRWPKKHFRVAVGGFLGDFPQVLGG